MPEDQASKKRRQRHFWSWVTGTKKLPKNEVSKDFKRLNNLRSQHAQLFPQYYEASKSFSVKEGIKEFHRKVWAFNESMRDNTDFVYKELFNARGNKDTAILMEKQGIRIINLAAGGASQLNSVPVPSPDK